MTRVDIPEGWEDAAITIARICVEEGVGGVRDVTREVATQMRSLLGGRAPTVAMVTRLLVNAGVDLGSPPPTPTAPSSWGRVRLLPVEGSPPPDDGACVHLVPTACGRLARVANGVVIGEVRDDVDGPTYRVAPDTIELAELAPRVVPRFSRAGRSSRQRDPRWRERVYELIREMQAAGHVGQHRAVEHIVIRCHEEFGRERSPTRIDVYKIVRESIPANTSRSSAPDASDESKRRALGTLAEHPHGLVDEVVLDRAELGPHRLGERDDDHLDSGLRGHPAT